MGYVSDDQKIASKQQLVISKTTQKGVNVVMLIALGIRGGYD